MLIVDDNKREFVFENQISSPLLEHIVDFECGGAPGDRARDSHRTDTVLVLVKLSRLYQLIFVLLGDGGERNRHLVSLENGKPNILMVVLSWIKRKHQSFLCEQIFVEGVD